MRTILLTLVVFLSQISIHNAQAQTTVGETAYLIGRQQVLAQQIARSYMAVELKMEVQTYKILLTDGINLFNSNLKKLEGINFSNEVSTAIEELGESWDDFYKELSDAPQQEEIFELVKMSAALLKKADEALVALEKYAEAKADVGIDLASLKMLKLAEQQNAISQHAILYYLAYWNGVKVEEFFSTFNKLVSEYESTFSELSESTDEFPEINKQILEAVYEWANVKKIITNMKEAPKKDDLRKVLNSADLLFRDSNEVAKSFKKMVDVGIANTNN